MLQFGNIVRYHRKKAKLTQSALAKMAGIGKTAVFDLEKGKRGVQLSTLLAVFDILNIQLELKSPLMQYFHEET